MLEILQKYEDLGLVRSQTHESLPLRIYNYTPLCQYEGSWDEVTLQCRGLVLDTETGEVVARPFSKFFNIEEEKHTTSNNFEVFEKMDGSLIVCFNYRDEWILCSRGSFHSDHAGWAKEIWDENDCSLDGVFENLTLCFELIHPDNRIVVDYNKERKLVLLGAIETNSNVEICYNELLDNFNTFTKNPFCCVKRYDGLDYLNIKNLNWENSEGFVVKFCNGERCKIKFEDYVKLHKIVFSLSTISVFESLRDNIKLNIEGIPDELHSVIKEYKLFLESEYSKIDKEYKDIFCHLKKHKLRKNFAKEAIKFDFSDILFLMFDNKDYSYNIYKRIKPKYKKL